MPVVAPALTSATAARGDAGLESFWREPYLQVRAQVRHKLEAPVARRPGHRRADPPLRPRWRRAGARRTEAARPRAEGAAAPQNARAAKKKKKKR